MRRLFDWLSLWWATSNASDLDREKADGEQVGSTACKWLPVIGQDYCTGCAKCVEVCEHGCLEMVWDFATLQRPEDCGSEGNCAAACPEDVIRMDWVPMTGGRSVGRWCEPLTVVLEIKSR